LPRDLLPGSWLELDSGRVQGLLAIEKEVKLQKL